MPVSTRPLFLAELGSIPARTITGELAIYARTGAIRLRRSTGSEEDLVLDRKLESYQIAARYSAITNQDSVKSAIAKLEAALANQPVTPTEPVVTESWTTSMSNGKTLGRYGTNEIVSFTATESVIAVLKKLSIETQYPTYQPASIVLTTQTGQVGEIGQTITVSLTSTFNRNDAGALTAHRISRNGTPIADVQIGTNPLQASDTIALTAQSTNYQSFASYAAGAAKSLIPASEGLDTRPAQVRNSGFPQAAEAYMPSNVLSFTGYLRLFFGPLQGGTPSSRALALALGSTNLVSDGNTFILNTGTSAVKFCILLPPGKTLTSVTDIDNLNANLTGAYAPQPTVSIADAGGTLVPGYTPYVLTAATPYANSARHQFTTT